jgi:O-antigen ligase
MQTTIGQCDDRTAVLKPGGTQATKPVSDVGSRGAGGDLLGGPSAVNAALILVLMATTYLIPSDLVFPPLGAAGKPSLIVANGLFVLLVLSSFRRNADTQGPRPVLWVVGVFFFSQLVTYLPGLLRGLTGIEMRNADRWMISVTALVAIVAFVSENVSDWVWLRRAAVALTWFGCLAALAGLLQFFVRFDVQDYISIPGLEVNRYLIETTLRGEGVTRVPGMMDHYIEFGVVIAMLVPLALHLALFAHTPREKLIRWTVLILLLVAVPTSVSRSGVVTLAIGLGLLAVVWPWRLRLVALGLAVVGLVGYRVIAPGVLGTLRALFEAGTNDPSVTGRTGDYEIIFPLIWERPIFGRGAGTFLPRQYIVVDNQYLVSWVEGGLVGLVGLVTLFAGAYLVARSIRRRARTAEAQHLAQALAATIAAGAVVSALFDSLSFKVFMVTLALLLGLTSALWRVAGVRFGDTVHPITSDWRLSPPVLRDVARQ